MFSELDEYLGLDFLVDYWYDEAQGLACAMLDRFQDTDWHALEACHRARPDDWRLRCAEAMSDESHHIATRMLISDLSDTSDDVVVAAADPLRCMQELGDIRIAPDDIERERTLKREGSRPVQGVLRVFLERFAAS